MTLPREALGALFAAALTAAAVAAYTGIPREPTPVLGHHECLTDDCPPRPKVTGMRRIQERND